MDKRKWAIIFSASKYNLICTVDSLAFWCYIEYYINLSEEFSYKRGYFLNIQHSELKFLACRVRFFSNSKKRVSVNWHCCDEVPTQAPTQTFCPKTFYCIIMNLFPPYSLLKFGSRPYKEKTKVVFIVKGQKRKSLKELGTGAN